MRRVVLQFWISLDGYSCDEGTELYRVMQEMPDDEQWDEYTAQPRKEQQVCRAVVSRSGGDRTIAQLCLA